MILDALVRYYQAVELPHPGWSKVKVSYGLKLNEEGEAIGTTTYLEWGKKEKKRNAINVCGGVKTPPYNAR